MQCQRAALCDSQWCGWHEFCAVCGRTVIFLHGVGMGVYSAARCDCIPTRRVGTSETVLLCVFCDFNSRMGNITHNWVF